MFVLGIANCNVIVHIQCSFGSFYPMGRVFFQIQAEATTAIVEKTFRGFCFTITVVSTKTVICCNQTSEAPSYSAVCCSYHIEISIG